MPTNKFSILKEKAEAKLAERPRQVDYDALSPEELRKKLEELNIYQIELELQNLEILEAHEKLINAANEQKQLRLEYQQLFDEAPVGYVILNSQGLITQANTQFCKLLGISEDSTIGRPLNKFVLPSDQAVLTVRFPAFFKDPKNKSISLSLVGQDRIIPVTATGGIVPNTKNDQKLLRFVLMDMTQVVELQDSLKLISRVFDVNLQGIMITDHSAKILTVNPAFTKITGYKASDVLGKTPSLLNSGVHDRSYYDDMWESIRTKGFWDGEIRNRKKNGEVYDERLTITSLKNDFDEVTHYIATFSDITREKSASSLIEHLAQYDQLTDLPNRRLLNDRLQQAIKQAQRNKRKVAVLFMDLDHFKSLNDTLGHIAGDSLLRQIALRLQDNLRSTDTISRFGGDEFVVVINDFDGKDDNRTYIYQVAKKLLASLRDPFEIDHHSYQTTFSMGISFYPDDGDNVQTILQHADAAMYQAKDNGRNNIAFFNDDLKASLLHQIELEQELHAAIDNNELRLYYQPQIELSSGKLVGVEALIRWMHPIKSIIAPDQFLNVAEKLGLMPTIDIWVVEQACKQIKSWLENGHPLVPISINLSYHQFKAESDIVTIISQKLEHYNVDARWLNVEVTETGIMNNIEAATSIIEQLIELGVNFALDDFGTGYSSLTYLRRLPVSTLKIDKSFVHDALDDDNDAIIISSIIAMTKGMNLYILAEGIETEEQAKYLLDSGCEYGQGYLYSRPIPAYDIAALYFK